MQIKELKSGRLYLAEEPGDSSVVRKAQANVQQDGERLVLRGGYEVVAFPAEARERLEQIIANPAAAAWRPVACKGGSLRAGLIGVSPAFDAYMAAQSVATKGDWEYIFPAENEATFRAAWLEMAGAVYAPRPFYNRVHEQLLERERAAVEYDRYGVFGRPGE